MPTALAPLVTPRLTALATHKARRDYRLFEAFFAGKSSNTVAAYRDDLGHFCRFLGLSDVDTQELPALFLRRSAGEANELALAFRNEMLAGGIAPATINRRLAAIRSLVKLANRLDMVGWTLSVDNVKLEAYRDTRGPTLEQVRVLFHEAAQQPPPQSERDTALLHLLFLLGLRASEVCGLDVAHVDFVGSRLAVQGKGRTQREWMALPVDATEALRRWLAARGRHDGPLFTNAVRWHAKHGQRLARGGLWHIIHTLGERCGVAVWPHGLRHAAVTTGLDVTGGDVRTVQRLSRHKKLETLTRYDDARRNLAGDVSNKLAAALRGAPRGTHD